MSAPWACLVPKSPKHAARWVVIANAGLVTNWQSLLHCAHADLTLERIQNLVAVTETEPVTVDFKQGPTPRIADCAAAMANTHGGLIIVGVTDADREIVGVPRETIGKVSGLLTARLDPPDWQPDVVEVPVGDDKPGRYVVVIRINRDIAPRPVFVQVAAKFCNERHIHYMAPVRIPGDTR